MSRGGQRDDILMSDVDWRGFIKALAEACQKTGWRRLASLAEPIA